MLEVEIQNLTKAVIELTEALRVHTASAPAPVAASIPALEKPKAKKALPPQKAEEPTQEPVPEPSSSITFKQFDQNDVRELAMQITRDDSTARPHIMKILNDFGAKTTNQLKAEDCQEVHARLMALAFKIAKDGEID